MEAVAEGGQIDDGAGTGAALTVSVVIPTLNEERNIAWVLEQLPPVAHEVIIVDGRSSDHTVQTALATRPDARIVSERRAGKGVALRAGFSAARGDVIVMMDADGSMHPAELTRYVEDARGDDLPLDTHSSLLLSRDRASMASMLQTPAPANIR